MKRLMITGLLGIFLLGLSACSSNPAGSNGKGAQLVDGTGSYSSGIGNRGGFNGQNTNRNTKLLAPYNQVYHFQFDSSSLEQADIASIQAQAVYLKSHASARVLLAGYTDQRGSPEYNMALGERRALSVREMLLVDGVKSSQVKFISYGEAYPIDPAHTESAYAKNRRVELTYEAK